MPVNAGADGVTVAPLAGDEATWAHVLARSANGTLFHDLRFLAYHPAGRHRFHHLLLRRRGEPFALLPGGLTGPAERPTFCSPLGASVGGFAAPADLRAETALSMTRALQDHARQQGWAGIEMTVPPPCYSEIGGTIEFALFCGGFRVEHRWLCSVLALDAAAEGGYERTFRSNQISAVRAARRTGLTAVERGPERLDDFLRVFDDTYARHGTSATHTADEIRDLLERLPDRVRLHLAMRGETTVAGLLLFHVTPRIGYTFYLCSSTEHTGEHGVAFLISDLIDRLPQRGVRYIDLGPSASDMKFNAGVTFFKEGLGALGQCRDRWCWQAAP